MTALAADAVTIRHAVDSDVALIYSSWLRSYWNATACHIGVDFATYQAGQRARIGRLLERHGAAIACSPEAPDTIMGWACVGGWTIPATGRWVNYVYVRQIYRRQGIASMLLAESQPSAATHMTPAFARCFPKVPFNPYLLEQTP